MKIENLQSDFQRIGSIDLELSDYPYLSFIDKTNGFIYTVSDDEPARIVKISIDPLSRISSIYLDYDYGNIYSGVIDTIRGFLYLTNISSTIIKIRLSDLTVSGTLATDIYYIESAIIDEPNGIAYFGDHDLGYIIKVDLLTFTVIDTILTTATYGFKSADIDTINGYGYFATDTGDGSTIPDAVKIRLSDMTVVASIFLPSGENYIGQVHVDNINNFCYLANFGIYGFQNKIIKTDISGTNFSRISSIDGVIRNYAGVIDKTRGFLYLAGEGDSSTGTTGNITKIDLSIFSIVDSLNLEPGEDLPDTGVIYEEIGYAYFATTSYTYTPPVPPKIVMIAIAPPPSATGTLNIGSNPSNANIFIDGIDTTMTTPASIDLSIGEHYYELVAAASGQTFYYNTGSVTIMPGETTGITSNLLNLPISPIINGTFDTDVSGWITNIVPFCEYNPGLPGNVCGNGDVLWDNSGTDPGRSRIRTYRCCNTSMSQSFIVNSRTFSFDWQTSTIYWYENPGYNIVIDSNVVVSEGLPVGYNTSISGTKTINLSQYIGMTATVTFYINGGTTPSGPYNVASCAALDHNDTFLYIDNVKTIIPIPTGPSITATDMTVTTSETPCITDTCTVTVIVRWTNSGGADGVIAPNITIDNVPQTPHADQTIPAGGYIDETFIVTGLSEDTHTICPDPN